MRKPADQPPPGGTESGGALEEREDTRTAGRSPKIAASRSPRARRGFQEVQDDEISEFSLTKHDRRPNGMRSI